MSRDLLDRIDQRTRLAGHNRLALLLFRLGTRQLFGVNVFKVQEVIPRPPLFTLPQLPSAFAGAADVRGRTVAVLDLARAIGHTHDGDEPNYLVVTEFNRTVQGFLVAGVERIVNIAVEDIQPPPDLGAAVGVRVPADAQGVVGLVDEAQRLGPGCRRRPVPGQVEDDASIRLGAGAVRTNLALLRAAREANPDAFIVWKPHPDVEAGLCDGAIARDDRLHPGGEIVVCEALGQAMPGPLDVGVKLWEHLRQPFYDKGPNDKGIGIQLGWSLLRVMVGYLLAVVVAIPIGFLIGMSPLFSRALDPFIQVLKPISPLAWMPLALYTIKDSSTSGIFVIFICSIWPMLTNTAFAVAGVRREWLNVARTLEVGTFRKIFRVILPAAAPTVAAAATNSALSSTKTSAAGGRPARSAASR